MSKRAITLLSLAGIMCLSLFSCKQEPEWISLFNGKDLTGWTPKIRGYEAGNNFANTFRVEDGLLTVNYDGYTGTFDDRFGHLFYDKMLSEYLLRLEFRFVGEQVAGGPGWAVANSGVMLHCQSAESMGIDQDFPISVETQFLSGVSDSPRPTGSVCTPGTHIDIDGKLVTNHCITSKGPTIPINEWVTMDILVTHDLIAHIVEGDTIMRYNNPVVGGGSVDGIKEGAKTDGKKLTEGYIALQSESHPIQFRKVLMKDLSEE